MLARRLQIGVLVTVMTMGMGGTQHGFGSAHGAAMEDGYRRAREIIMQGRAGRVLPWHVDEALAREDARGATARQLVNLKRLGYDLVVRERGQSSHHLPAEDPSRRWTPASVAAPRAKGPEASSRSWSEFRAQTSCSCGSRRKPRVSDGSRGQGWAGLSGFATMALIWLVGAGGAAAIGCAIMSMGCLVKAISTRLSCDTCGRPIKSSGSDGLVWPRLKLLLGAAAFGVVALLLGKLWLWAVMASNQ